MAGGRPTDYTPELAAELFARMVGGLSLRKICEADDMPDRTTFFVWIQKHTEFANQYAIAAEARSEALVEDMLEIADNGTNDWMIDNDPDNPGYRLNGEHINRSRLRVDVRKWHASKLKPKKYGEKLDVDHTGSVSIQVVTGVPDANNNN